MFQSVGFSHPKYTPLIKKLAAVFSWLLIAGFVSIPIAIVAGIVAN
jgi:succinate dehydrogenase / fumarate reductase, cytochrome b subunit